jgi:hypothetical protein
MQLIVPLTKVDATKQEVWGVLAAEIPDSSNEIFDYALSKPYFEKWNEHFEKVTDGKSLGNLRAMHGSVAAGKFIDFQYDDANKMIHVGAKVVDPAEWKKVTEGVYTGFSIGGKYVKQWPDGDLTRYVANPSEGSLVDAPCIPTALFQMIKDGGAVEFRKFQTQGRAAMSKTTLGPALLKVSVLAKVSPDDVHTLMSTLEEMSEDGGVPKNVKKPMMALLDALNSMSLGEMKTLADGDASNATTAGGDTGASDTGAAATDADATAQKDDAMAMAQKSGELQKKTNDLLTTLTGEITKLANANTALAKRIETLEKQPAAGKGNTRAVTKEEDGGGVDKKALDPATATANDLIKAAHSKPIPYMQPAA